MSGLKRLIHEIHRRSLWQVVLIYVAASWAVLEAADVMVSRLALPEWVYGAAIVLLLVGLPIVLATAFVQEGISPTRRHDPTLMPGGELEVDAGPREVAGARELFTWRNAIAGGVLALALWGVVATGWYVLYGGAASPPSVDRKSVAVLPFANIGGNPENEYFSDGITGEIIAHLSKIADLKVISRTSVMQYKNTEKNIRQIGEELDVATILEGELQRAGERIRINAQLIDAEDEGHLWSEQYDRELTDVFAIQSDVAQRIAAALKATLSPAEKERLEKKPTENLEAYEYYLKGTAEWRRRDYARGVEMLELAVQTDPDFAAAWAMLARIHFTQAFERSVPGSITRGEETLNRAVELAPDAFETHIAQARYYRLVTGELEKALGHLGFAEELRPNDPEVLRQLGTALRFAGRWNEALAYIERALDLDPLNARVANTLGQTYWLLGRFAEAERYLGRAIALDPSANTYHEQMFQLYMRGLGDTVKVREFAERYPERSELWLADLNYVRRDYKTAIEAFRSHPMTAMVWRRIATLYYVMNERDRLRTLGDSARSGFERQLEELIESGASPSAIALMHILLGYAYAYMGDEDSALREAREALDVYSVASDARNYYKIPWSVGNIHLLVGHHDEAIDYFELMLSVPTSTTAAWLRINPLYDTLRSHPRFQALLEREH